MGVSPKQKIRLGASGFSDSERKQREKDMLNKLAQTLKSGQAAK